MAFTVPVFYFESVNNYTLIASPFSGSQKDNVFVLCSDCVSFYSLRNSPKYNFT